MKKTLLYTLLFILSFIQSHDALADSYYDYDNNNCDNSVYFFDFINLEGHMYMRRESAPGTTPQYKYLVLKIALTKLSETTYEIEPIYDGDREGIVDLSKKENPVIRTKGQEDINLYKCDEAKAKIIVNGANKSLINTKVKMGKKFSERKFNAPKQNQEQEYSP